MNKKGFVGFYGLMLGITIIILALALAPVISNFSETARNKTSGDIVGLDCNNDSISNFDKATCIATDLTPFYFIGSLILIGGGVLITKIIFS